MTEIRVGDAERAQAVQQLEQHAAAGRFAPDELAERTRRAQAAVYDVDLDALFADLPGGRQEQEFHWQQMPSEPSGVSDGPADATRPRPSGPVVSGPVTNLTARQRGELRAPLNPAAIIAFVVLFLAVMAILMRFGGFGSFFFLWFFALPALGRIGRGRGRRR